MGASVSAAALFAWLILLPLYFITGENLYFALFVFLGIFMAPLVWGVITAFMGEEKISNTGKSITKFIIILCGSTIFISGLSVAIYQIYQYLKQGKWVSFSVIDGLQAIDSLWAKEP